MKYVVKITNTATEQNKNFKGEVHTYYIGKDGYVWSNPCVPDAWTRKAYAQKFIEKDKEWDAENFKKYPFWTSEYEIIELD